MAGKLASTIVANQPRGRPGELLPHGHNLVEVGGGGNCFYATMLDQIICDGGEQKSLLRAAKAQYLLHNRSNFQQDCMVIDDEKPVSVEDYTSRVSTTGEYAGNVQIAIMARLTIHDIVIYSMDQGVTRTISVDDSSLSQ